MKSIVAAFAFVAGLSTSSGAQAQTVTTTRGRFGASASIEWLRAGSERPEGFGVTGGLGVFGSVRYAFATTQTWGFGADLGGRVLSIVDPTQNSFGWGLRVGTFVERRWETRIVDVYVRGVVGYHYTWLPLANATGILVRFHTGSPLAGEATLGLEYGRGRGEFRMGCAYVETIVWTGCMSSLSFAAGGQF